MSRPIVPRVRLAPITAMDDGEKIAFSSVASRDSVGAVEVAGCGGEIIAKGNSTPKRKK